MHQQHAAVSDITGRDAVTDTARVDDTKVDTQLAAGRRGDEATQVGLLVANRVAITNQQAICRANDDIQLLLTFLLIIQQGVIQLGILGDLVLYELHLGRILGYGAVGIDRLALGVALDQVDRDQVIAGQGQLAILVLKLGTAHILAPLVSLHDPGAVLLIRLAVITRFEIGVLVGGTRFHTDRILGVATNDGIQSPCRQCTSHLYIARRIAAVLTILVMAHVSDGEDQIGLLVTADLLAQFSRLAGRIAELQGLHVVGINQLRGILGGQAQYGDLETALQLEHLVGVKVVLTAGLVIDVGRKHGELGPLALLLQHAERVVEFMVAHCHGIVANVVHRHEVRLGILQIGLRHPGIHITTGENQYVTASSLGIGTQLLDQSLLGSHTILIFSVVPETAVGIVGVQDGQFADIFGAGCNGVIARGITASQCSKHGQCHAAFDKVIIHFHITLIVLLFINPVQRVGRQYNKQQMTVFHR